MKKTSTRVIAFSLVAIASFALAEGCGGSQPARPPKSAPTPESTEEAPSAPAGSMAAPQADSVSRSKAESQYPTAQPSPAAPPPPMAPAPVAPTTVPAPATAAASEGRGSREASLRRASSEFDAAQRALEAAAGDCASACRALGSMDRAAGHLCALASDGDDRRRCEAAKTRVQAARDRVRTTCGTCPGGPSVERSAPIPSQ